LPKVRAKSIDLTGARTGTGLFDGALWAALAAGTKHNVSNNEDNDNTARSFLVSANLLEHSWRCVDAGKPGGDFCVSKYFGLVRFFDHKEKPLIHLAD